MKKTLLLILIMSIIGLAGELSAQAVITGKVIDAQTGEALPGATVAVAGTTTATLASADGSFELNAAAGELAINISYIGYLAEQVKITVSAGETKDLGEIEMKADDIGMEELLIIASYAKDRETPVSVSTIKPEMIMEKLGTQEFPEILKSTPSVYATKEGGGYGDGRINLRGFSSDNIGVLINGVPVNDMENGRVYWSNWAGLSDVTRTMQVQRGLGASKLAISSVGGTINIITKTTDAKKGGSIYYGIGNNGYTKTGFTLSTGMYDNGWAVTVSGSKTAGEGYVKATNFEAWSYFFNVAKQLSDKQQISFTAFGAPQWHHQRSSQQLIQRFKEHPDGIRFNTDYGYRNGEIYNGAYAFNKYHKPQLSLNHTWEVSRSTKWSTAVYASKSQGGGRRVSGPQDQLLTFNYPNGVPYEDTQLTPEGYLDYDAVIDINKQSLTGSQAIVTMSTNAHDWYGILSSLNTSVGNINFTAGIDGRYYRGYHYTEIDDLLGGEYYLDNSNINREQGTPLHKGDKISYYNLTDVTWAGVFAQAEYVVDDYSAFLSVAGSQTSYMRTDYFQYTPEEGQSTEWVPFVGYSAKGGFNYNINSAHNVFVNGGYFERAPFANSVFMNYRNEINQDAKPQRVLSAELGYGYRTKFVQANLNGYRTAWMDKTITRSIGQETANITGLNAIHQGIEFEATITPVEGLDIRLMASYGDWLWENDVNAALFDQDQNFIDSLYIYAEDIHVSNAAQTTAAVGVDYMILPQLKVGLDYNYYDRLFAEFEIEDRTKPELSGVDAWQLPEYHLMDFNISYRFKIGKLNSSIYGNVNNIFDTEYIADASDNTKYDETTQSVIYGSELNSPVYFGFGRTWSIGLKVRF